jgi:hypothetical protein
MRADAVGVHEQVGRRCVVGQRRRAWLTMALTAATLAAAYGLWAAVSPGVSVAASLVTAGARVRR